MNSLQKTLANLDIFFSRSPPSPDNISGSATGSPGAPVALELTSNGMIILGLIDTEDPSVDISPYLSKSHDFHKLTGYHKTLLKRYPQKDGIPLGRLVKAGYLITFTMKRIAAFEKNVRRLIILSEKISFDTPLLQVVKKHIDNASFSKAYEALNNYDMIAEQKFLLEAKTGNNVSPIELDARLRTNATSFFLKALLVELDSSKGFHPTSAQLFKSSIENYTFPENTFEYCICYQKIYACTEVEPHYQQIICSEIPDSNRYGPLALHNLGVLYTESRDLTKAEAQFLEALVYYRDAEKRNPGVYTPHIAATQANLALLYKEKKDFPRAKKMFHDSVDQFRRLVKTDISKFLPACAWTLKHYADTCTEYNDLKTAAGCYQEAAAMYRELVKTDEERFQPPLFDTLSASIELSIQTGTKREESDNASEALTLCRDLAQKNPGEYLPHLAKVLNQIAVIHAENGLPDLAEMELREGISIYRRFRKLQYHENPFTHNLAKALNDIGVLYMSTNRPNLANRELSRSIALYHRLTFSPFALLEMCMVLNNLSTLYQHGLPDQNRSIELACKSMYIIRPFTHRSNSIRMVFRESVEILQYWGISEEKCAKTVQNTQIVQTLKTKFPHLYK